MVWSSLVFKMSYSVLYKVLGKAELKEKDPLNYLGKQNKPYLYLQNFRGQVRAVKIYLKGDPEPFFASGYSKFEGNDNDIFDDIAKECIIVNRRGVEIPVTLDLEQSIYEIYLYMAANDINLLQFQQNIHYCGLKHFPRALEILNCSEAWKL